VETIGNLWMWVGFTGIVLVMLAVDLFVVGGGKEHRVSMREAATWSCIWVSVASPQRDGGTGISQRGLSRIHHRLLDRKILSHRQRLRLANAFLLLCHTHGTPETRTHLRRHWRDRDAHDHDLRWRLADREISLAALRLWRFPVNYRHQDVVVCGGET
jgi:hypothetical protein